MKHFFFVAIAVLLLGFARSASAQADLSLSAALGVPASGTLTVGASQAYYLTVSNLGPSTATGIVISNRIPANETFYSASVGAATTNNGVLLVNLGSLAAGAVTNVTLTVYPTVPAGQAIGQLTNLFQVSANETDPVLTNNVFTAVTTIALYIPGAPLTSSSQGNPGGNLVVESGAVFGTGPIQEQFNGPIPNSTLTAEPGDLIVLANPNGGNNPTNWAAVVRFFNPSDPTGTNGLAATYSQAFFATNFGGSGFANFTLFPNTDFVTVNTINTINGVTTIAFTDSIFGPVGSVVLAGQEDIIVWTVISPFTDLSLRASAAPEPVTVGNPVTYSLTVSNSGALTATGVVISNQIPAGVSFLGASGGATPVNGILLMNLGSLAAGTNVTVLISEHTTTTGRLTNVFRVSSDLLDPVLSNNTATVVSTVTNATVSGGFPGTPLSWNNPGGSVTVTAGGGGIGVQPLEGVSGVAGFTITNCTPGDVVIVNTNNASLNPTNWGAVIRFFNPADPTGAQGLPATKQQTFFGGNVPNGFASFQLFLNTLYLTNASIISGAYNASATQFGPVGGILAGQTHIIIYTANLQPTNTDLSLSASGVFVPTLAVGQSNVVYTLTVSNAGPSAATGVVISNQIPTYFNFVSATVGVTTNNGILLANLGSLAAGATNSIQIVMFPGLAGDLGAYQATNVFAVFADQTDPVPTNNSATVVSRVNQMVNFSTSSSLFEQTNLTASVNQPATNYSTELIAKLPNGTVVYDQTFAVPFSNAALQAAVTQAATSLTNAGASSYTGPTQTSFLKSLSGVSSVTVTNATGTNISITSTVYVGPQTIFVGNNQTNPFTLGPGQTDSDTLVIVDLTNLLTTTVTSNYLNTTVYVMTGVVAQASADLSLSGSGVLVPSQVIGQSNVVYTLTVSNAGPSAATGVVISNQVPFANLTIVSATGGATPTNGVLLVNLGALAVGATSLVQIVEFPVGGGVFTLTNVFQVLANQNDPNPTNNSANITNPFNEQATTSFTTSTLLVQTNFTANVKQQATNYSTELIAKLPNGSVVYDHTFTNIFSDAAVQAAVTTAAMGLTNAGAISYTGPTQTSFLQSLSGISLVIMTNLIGSNVTATVTQYVGPTNIFVGNEQTNLLVLSPGTTDYDTLIVADLTNLLTTTITSNYLNSSVYVMTGVVTPTAGVTASISSAPNPAQVGLPLTYSLVVTNNSGVPATGVVLSNTLPAGVTLVSVQPSQGTVSTNATTVIYNVGSLTNGFAATLGIVVIPHLAGQLTDRAIVFAGQSGVAATNTQSLQDLNTAVAGTISNLVLTVVSIVTLNPQTGLFEEQINVANGGPSTPSSVQVLVGGLPGNVRLYNGSGLTNGVPYVQSAGPLGVGANVVFTLEFYVPTRVAPTNLTLTVQAAGVTQPTTVNGTIQNVTRTVALDNGTVLVEFASVPGQVYAIQYSSDQVTWLTAAVPLITAPANRVQWIDAGPPETASAPPTNGLRHYRVVLLPKN